MRVQKGHYLDELVENELLDDGVAVGLLEELVVVFENGGQGVGVVVTDLEIITTIEVVVVGD